jgi:serine/threonine protein kinase
MTLCSRDLSIMSSNEEVSMKKSKYERLLDDPHANRLKFPSTTEEYQFNLSDLQREEMICKNIEHYTFLPLKFPLAVKSLIIISQRRVDEEKLEKAIEEVKILQKLSHDINIIDYYGYALDKERVWIFMELMDTSLEDLYRKFHEQIYQKNKSAQKIVIPEDVVGVIAVCVLDALAFCKKQRVLHRDVKPRNVLVNKKGQVKLCDFGVSKILESGKSFQKC